MNISSPKFSFSSDFMYTLAPMGHYHHHKPQRIFSIYDKIINCGLFFIISFYINITLSNTYYLCTRTEASFQTFSFHVNIRHELMLYFFVPNMVNINLGIEVLNIFHSCMDTTEPPRHWRHRLEVEYSNKDQLIPSLFAIVIVWIATKQTIGTNFKMSCLVIVTKRCHVIGTPPFPSAECKYIPWILE